MMKKVTLYVLLAIGLLVSSTVSVFAQDIYVDPNRADANEDGTKDHPYNTEKEGEAYAQSLPDGGYVYVKNPDGTWPDDGEFVPATLSGGQGAPYPQLALYLLLAILALVLIVVGRRFRRQARQSTH